MGCGCKKKKIQPAGQPRKIVVVEGEVRSTPEPTRPPEVLKAPPRSDTNIDNVVNKLNEILTPRN